MRCPDGNRKDGPECRVPHDEMVRLRERLVELSAQWEAGHRALIERVALLEAWQVWVQRLVLGLVITALIGLVIAGISTGMDIHTFERSK